MAVSRQNRVRITIVTIFLLLLGGGGAAFAYFYFRNHPVHSQKSKDTETRIIEGYLYDGYIYKTEDGAKGAWNKSPDINHGRGAKDGRSYTQRQIDAKNYDGEIPIASSVVGLNIKAVGAGDDQTYTQRQIDARDYFGESPKSSSLLGLNARAVGLGNDKTFTQAQIDARDTGGPYPSRPDMAVVGINKKWSLTDFTKKFSQGNFLLLTGRRVSKWPYKKDPPVRKDKRQEFINYMDEYWDPTKSGFDYQARTMNDFFNDSKIQGWMDCVNSAEDMKKQLSLEYDWDDYNNGHSPIGGGDGSGHTYTQAQIDHAKGGDLVAPAGAVAGKNKKATGDGSGRNWSQAAIDRRDGLFAPSGAVVGKNTKGTGDGSGITWSQAAVDKRDGLDQGIPAGAVVGLNAKADKIPEFRKVKTTVPSVDGFWTKIIWTKIKYEKENAVASRYIVASTKDIYR